MIKTVRDFDDTAPRGKALALLFAGMFFSSLIAPISAYSKNYDPFSLIAGATALTAIVHVFVINKKAVFEHLSVMPGVLWAIFGGAVLMWGHAIFFHSMRETQNAILPTIAFEMYPLGTIILANIIRFRERLSLESYFWIALSVAGVVLISVDLTPAELAGAIEDPLAQVGDDGQGFKFDDSTLVALVAVFLISLGMVSISRSADEFIAVRERKGRTENVERDASLYASMIGSGAGAVALLPGVGGLFSADYAEPDAVFWLVMVVYGMLVLFLSRVTYYWGIAISKSHLVNIIYNLAPVFSIVFVMLTPEVEAQFTYSIGIAAAAILTANLMLNLDLEGKAAYKASVFWALAAGSLIFFLPQGFRTNFIGADYADSFPYFEAMAAALIFFGLLYGFIITRFNERTDREHEAAFALAREALASKDLSEEQRRHWVEGIFDITAARATGSLKRHYERLLMSNPALSRHDRFNGFVFSKTQGVTIGENYILWLTALIVIFTAIFLKPPGFIYDAYAFLISVCVVFVGATILDARNERNQKLADLASSADGEPMLLISRRALKSYSSAEMFIVVSMLAALAAVFLFLLFLKSTLGGVL